MKKYIYTTLAVLSLLLNYSCEEVINVKLTTAEPKLVVEASIDWQKGTTGNSQKIRLTTTGDFYANTVPAVTGATVTIKNSKGDEFNFYEKTLGDEGYYFCDNFVPAIDEEFTLEITTPDGTKYKATETMKSVSSIIEITQEPIKDQTGTKDPIKLDLIIKGYFQDPADVDNYYLFQILYHNSKSTSDYSAISDELFKGNEFYSTFGDVKLAVGDTVNIVHKGISKRYYNYMNVISKLGGVEGAGPFGTQPVSAKGNVLNITNPNENAFGYFSLSEKDVKEYVIRKN